MSFLPICIAVLLSEYTKCISAGRYSGYYQSFSAACFQWELHLEYMGLLDHPLYLPAFKENAVSTIVTDRFFRTLDKAAFAIKYSIPTPIYDIPLFFAFALENNASKTLRAIPTADANLRASENNAPNHQFIFGTSYGNFGLGVLIQIGRETLLDIRDDQSEIFRYSVPRSEDAFRKNFDGYGFEFGYINAANPSEGYAGVISLLYKRYGGTNETINANKEAVYRENRPFLKVIGISETVSAIRQGANRQEVELRLLGWYHITKLLNVGASFNWLCTFFFRLFRRQRTRNQQPII